MITQSEYQYPTEVQLEKIRRYDLSIRPVEGLLEYVYRYFWNPEWCWDMRGKRVYQLWLHTGGWSGNESIIEALRENMFFFTWWEKSTKGGHHFFKIKRLKGFKNAPKSCAFIKRGTCDSCLSYCK